MKKPRPLVVLLLAAAMIAGGIWYFHNNSGSPQTVQRTYADQSNQPPTGQQGLEATPGSRTVTPAQFIATVFDLLRSEGLRPGELNAFRRGLLAADPRAAIEAIAAFLATGRDALTAEQFEIGENGELTGAPTFRVLLLDLLGRLGREHGISGALTVSRKLLESRNSADEWAVALRNTAWLAPDDRAFLSAKTRELITHQPWRRQPSSGFQEAFDIIVFTRDVTFIPDLAEMLRDEGGPLQRSAGMALDRLAEMSPLEVMNYLNTNPAELSDLPFLRADYYSKADLSHPAQRAAVEAYLSRADVDRSEKEKLLSAFGSPGSFAADTLVTEPPPDEFPASFHKGLRASVDDWIRGNRFPELTPSLLNLRAHLAE